MISQAITSKWITYSKIIRLILMIAMIIVNSTTNAQTEFKEDTLFVKGKPYLVGQKLKLGKPIHDREHFTYVTVSNMQTQINAAGDGLNGGESSNGFGKDYGGRYIIIKKIKKTGNEEFGYKYYVVCKTPGLLNAWVDLENAIEAKEVLIE